MMMRAKPKEIEVKFRVDNLASFASKLKSLKATLLWRGIEKNYYLDTKGGRLKDSNKILRVREWGGHSNSLTFKSDAKADNKRKYKIRNELQTEIGETAILLAILKELGFKIFFEYKKSRAHYQLGDIHIELDTLDGQNFIEIERPKKNIDEMAEILGIDWAQRESRSYLDLARKKNKNKK